MTRILFGAIMKLQFFYRVCCEYCNELEGMDFHCPDCKKQFAETSVYSEGVEDKFKYTDVTLISCQNCGAEFRPVGERGDDADKWEWEIVRNAAQASHDELPDEMRRHYTRPEGGLSDGS